MDTHIDSHEYDTVSLLPDALVDRLYARARILPKDVKGIEWTALARAATHFPQLLPLVEGDKGVPLDVFLTTAEGKRPVTLFPHQLDMLEFMKKSESFTRYGIRGGILNVEMGLGKTLVALAHACRYPSVPECKGKGTLIVCSKMLLSEWKTAGVEKFFTSDYAPKVLYYHSMFMKRKKYLSTTAAKLAKYDIVITTYECVNASFKGTNRHKPLHSKPWARVCWDESQKVCSATSMGYKASKALKYDAGWCLTGTPFRNGYNDYWTQFSLCGYFGCPKKRWKNAVFYYMDAHRLKESILTLTTSQTGITLPKKKKLVVNTELTGRNLQLFETIKNRVRVANKNHDIDNSTFTDVLALLTTLRQIGIAPYLAKDKLFNALSPEQQEWIQDKEGEAGYKAPKIRKTIELVREAIARGEQVVIFSTLSTAIELIIEAINHDVPEAKATALTGKVTGGKRAAVLAGFKSGESRVLGLSFKLGSEGLNLTEAENAIFVDHWWNSATHRQAEARSWRIGQHKEVTTVSIFDPKGVDVLCENVCEIKDREEESLNRGVPLKNVIKIALGEFLKRQKK